MSKTLFAIFSNFYFCALKLVRWIRAGDKTLLLHLAWIKHLQQKAIGSYNNGDFSRIRLERCICLQGRFWRFCLCPFDWTIMRALSSKSSPSLRSNPRFDFSSHPTPHLRSLLQKEANRVQFSILSFIYDACICWNCFPYLISHIM